MLALGTDSATTLDLVSVGLKTATTTDDLSENHALELQLSWLTSSSQQTRKLRSASEFINFRKSFCKISFVAF